MNENPRHHITPKQFIFVAVGAMIGTGVLSMPRAICESAGQDAWISIIIGALLPLLSLVLTQALCKKFPNLSLADMSRLLFGKAIGTIFIVIFLLYIIYINSIITRIFTEIAALYLLPKTPLPVTLFLSLTAATYIISKGLKVVARLDELLFYILLFALALQFPSLTVSDYTNILPVGGSGVMNILKGACETMYFFAGIELLIIIYPFIQKKENVVKSGAIAIALVTVIYVLVQIICILVFGTDAIKNIIWPAIVILKISDVGVIERLELFFLAMWMGLALRPSLNYGFSATFTIAKLFKIEKFKNFKFVAAGYWLLIFILAFIPKNTSDVFKYSSYTSYGFLITAIGYPIIFNVTAIIRKMGVVNEKK